MKKIKVCLFSGGFIGALLAFPAIIFPIDGWKGVVAAFLIGFCLGLIAAPELEPKAFKRPWLFQTLSAASIGVIGAVFLGASLPSVLGVALIGGLVGWLAPMWIKAL